MSDKKRVFEGMASHVDNDPENTYCLRDKYGCMASTDVDWLGRLLGQNVRITIEHLPVAPMSIGTVRYGPNAKPTPKKPLEPIIHPKYGLLVCEYDYTKPWSWFIAKDYVLELGNGWIKVYHEAWKPAAPAPDMLEMVYSGIRYILSEYGRYSDLGEDEWGPVKDHLMNLIPPAPGPGADDSNGGGA